MMASGALALQKTAKNERIIVGQPSWLPMMASGALALQKTAKMNESL
jgi:hypothetical protein